jgi:Lon protease-like protein
MGRTKLVCGVAIAGLFCAGATVKAQTTLPSVIPIFPLEPTMLFPGVSRPLYIFEGRYRTMVADAMKGDRIIGMVTFKPGYEANYRGRPPIYEIGCAGVITEFEELPGGRFSIVLRGLVKFRVTSEDDSRPYRLAHVAAIPEVLNDEQKAELRKRRQHLEALITKGGSSKVPPETSDEELINMVAQYLPMDTARRQQLLELENPLLRVEALIEAIEAKVGVVVWL